MSYKAEIEFYSCWPIGMMVCVPRCLDVSTIIAIAGKTYPLTGNDSWRVADNLPEGMLNMQECATDPEKVHIYLTCDGLRDAAKRYNMIVVENKKKLSLN